MPEYVYFSEQVSFSSPQKIEQIRLFLENNDLELDNQILRFIVYYSELDNKIIACGGVAHNIIKCVAISSEYRGTGLALKLATDLINLAYDIGYSRLFIYTKPENEFLFSQCGFFTISTAYPHLVLMENSKMRLQKYCNQLRNARKMGKKIGAIVMNANPFTLGHRYLIEQAVVQCDYVHIFLVEEDASRYAYADRLRLLKKGIGDLRTAIIHPSSSYIISRATFPAYFLKDQGLVDKCYMEIDLKLFRRYIAPTLGITHRFVGTEPFCQLTAAYNQNMHYWLEEAEMAAPPIKVVEIERKTYQGQAISASTVRKLADQKNWQELSHFVPDSTLSFLQGLAVQTQD
ncbi:[citrate (pro-3S)-lyase] ligase [Avibacterium paragallinarum]|uniref:[Citrate [pro-3S]-lyase] ligase n=1 Tax=Avibacterium paragallinarum TaxID=728 RepID=A0A0F5EYP4_AVIPA|nr:[citrate (pro-3S)-lyase] ligase [Avibacterium paragallinarum]KAA6208608.1 [citrate (pro-3S)-lyase] ligase [Avibacterium paragallinarum]KKB01723.1 citrate (pro-3S)-lyase [Avibacterium paragallinarum]POY46597.1 [citrate (pro-3S)-lyase] ligase [Avibacterium paragallinarum]RZN56197.1 [citrate (pro-3S)-lyase] ligase [Avibacterium paragallinarum]RZN57608.1 [citrate (pro-3S)-lyase] ligase [Avibacterium paragallinarum]